MERRGLAALAVALPVGALVVDPGGLAPFGPVKWLVVPTLVLAATAVALRSTGDRPIVLARRPMLAWGAFLAVVVVAAMLGVDRVYAWTGTPERHFGALTWGLCALAFITGQLAYPRAAVAGAVVACGVAGTWAVAETLGWEPVELVGAGNRAVGPFGSSAYLGAALALLAPVAIGVALDPTWSTRARRLAGAAAAAGGAGLVASGARAAWAGALVAAVVAVWVRRPRVTARVAAAVAVGTGAVLVVLALATGVAQRVPDVVEDRDGGARGRLDEWRVATRVIATRPALGVGPEGYRIAFGRSVDDAYERAHGRTPLPDRAHSAPLDVAATTGVAGLIAYGALLLTTGALVLRALRHAPPWLAGTAAGLVAYAAQALFLFPIAELEPVAWLLAGIVVATSERTLLLRPRRWMPVAAATLAAVALAAGALDVAADHAAKDIVAGDTGDPTRAARLRPDALRYRIAAARRLPPDAAIEQLDHALAVSPKDPVVRGERARLLLGQDPAQALDALRDLAKDDPRNAEVLLRLGLAHALTGDSERAEQAWRRAEYLAPESAAASTNLAVAYAQQDRWPEAVAAATRALDRDPDNARARAVLDEAEQHGT
ncbi:MAG: hypothetical protein QOG87_2 [Actinomycetota bacterium]|jgi:O-antigen ligase